MEKILRKERVTRAEEGRGRQRNDIGDRGMTEEKVN